MPAKSTGEAIAKARQDIAAARVADPGEHFPYKAKVVEALLTKDAPLGPEGPKDTSVSVQDVMSRRIAEATEAYINAQQAHLEDPSDAHKAAYEAAKDDLVAARRTHRRGRVDADGNPVGGVIGTSRNAPAEHARGPRLRRVGEE